MAIIGTGSPATLLDYLDLRALTPRPEKDKSLGPDVIVVYEQPRTRAWHRMFKIVKRLKYMRIAVRPKHYHNYRMLIRYFRGSIVKMMQNIRHIMLCRKIRCGSSDAVVNKRKRFLKQLKYENR